MSHIKGIAYIHCPIWNSWSQLKPAILARNCRDISPSLDRMRASVEMNTIYKHMIKETLSIQQLQGNTSTAGLLSSSWIPRQSITNEAWQTNHPMQALYGSPCSSTRMPTRNSVPLDFANIPKHARYMKLPLHSPTIISRNAPATKDARVTPPGPPASSPSACKSFNDEYHGILNCARSYY
jgi:hypothetical protein